MSRLILLIKESSLSIVLLALFLVCISAQSLAGWRLQIDTLAAHGIRSIGYWRYLSGGTFLEGLASNWQAAVLQLASLIVFSGFLYQRGAPHSRDPRKAKRMPIWGNARGVTWLYRKSLFLAFLLLFILALLSWLVRVPTMRNVRWRASRPSPSQAFCFRQSFGR